MCWRSRADTCRTPPEVGRVHASHRPSFSGALVLVFTCAQRAAVSVRRGNERDSRTTLGLGPMTRPRRPVPSDTQPAQQRPAGEPRGSLNSRIWCARRRSVRRTRATPRRRVAGSGWLAAVVVADDIGRVRSADLRSGDFTRRGSKSAPPLSRPPSRSTPLRLPRARQPSGTPRVRTP